MRRCPVSLLCSRGMSPGASLGSCPSRYHPCFPKSIAELLRVPSADGESDASRRGSSPSRTESAHQSSRLVRASKSSVAFRPTLGRRWSSEPCRRACGGRGAERGSLQPASRPEPVHHDAVAGGTVPQPQHLWGLSEYLGCRRR